MTKIFKTYSKLFLVFYYLWISECLLNNNLMSDTFIEEDAEGPGQSTNPYATQILKNDDQDELVMYKYKIEKPLKSAEDNNSKLTKIVLIDNIRKGASEKLEKISKRMKMFLLSYLVDNLPWNPFSNDDSQTDGELKDGASTKRTKKECKTGKTYKPRYHPWRVWDNPCLPEPPFSPWGG
ncbi:hypothetical protein HELRODRAFT_167746 [Helobdella robusta]|uniref:Uncharacterized protein n=1 Tax=Helobdella robusta TaxID=6412 RepID=T1EZQ8_HELRO|nr:hypothetical protein HELRODRAFT_167746 [Helobdella robusta]ESO09921.1 hypothetical protein HELRODRAFT_167746 [Helobdella robusta]